MAEDLKKTQVISELLQQTTSLAVVRNFLKEKGLTHSAGSWEDMVSKRILPAIENYQLSNDELIELLRSVEECGHQHVFLYSCPKAKAVDLLSRGRVENSIRRAGLDDLLVAPKVLNQPSKPEIVDVRLETADVELSLTIKQVELRKSFTFVGTEQYGNQIHKLYDLVEERAVNLARLHRDGLLEIRIASLANSTKYESALRAFWSDIAFFLPIDEFSELSLSIVKERFWTEREELGELIRHSDSTIRDEEGNVLRAATGSDRAGLGMAVGQSLDHLLQTDQNAYCEGANIWFKKSDSLSADTHVLLGGESNEFALPAHCSEEDYKYVLSKLRSFNKRVP